VRCLEWEGGAPAEKDARRSAAGALHCPWVSWKSGNREMRGEKNRLGALDTPRTKGERERVV